jgi:hypothetical protein
MNSPIGIDNKNTPTSNELNLDNTIKLDDDSISELILK